MSGNVRVWTGDCVEVLRTLPAGRVDAVVTDPPYALEFMGKDWDRHDSPAAFQKWCQSWGEECLRVLKPGGYLLAFGGTRTYHRLVCGLEDAGFEIRDSLHWIYGSGFPKSLDVSKAIDKAAGAERTDEAQRWNGWGTALKPAHEPIVLARKPLSGTVASNVLAHGTGALNIDSCRIATNGETFRAPQSDPANRVGEVGSDLGISRADKEAFQAAQRASIQRTQLLGRWPPNVILSHGPGCDGECQPGCPVAELGEPARFFYCAKASRRERPQVEGVPGHPTTKPLDLMRWLIRLVTPPGGLILDPFAGTGTTAEAAVLEGRDYRVALIEKEPDYLPLIEERLRRR